VSGVEKRNRSRASGMEGGERNESGETEDIFSGWCDSVDSTKSEKISIYARVEP
jgi:hypothetical protein